MKRGIAFCFSFMLTLCLVGCSEKDITFDLDETNSIQIIQGATNDKIIIGGTGSTQDITNNINSLKFEKAEKAVGQIGWTYILSWLDEDLNETASIIIVDENGNTILLGGYYYTVKGDKQIDTGLITQEIALYHDAGPAPTPTPSAATDTPDE